MTQTLSAIKDVGDWFVREAANYGSSSFSGANNLFLKPAYMTLDWHKELGGTWTSQEQNIHWGAKTFKNLTGCFKLPSKTLAAVDSLGTLYEQGSIDAMSDAFFDVLGVVPEAADGMSALDALGAVDFSKNQLWYADKLNLVSLFFSMSREIYRDFSKLALASDTAVQNMTTQPNNWEERQRACFIFAVLTLIQLAIAVSYVALSVFALNPVL